MKLSGMEEAKSVLAEHYGFQGEMTPLAGEVDSNFLVKATSGERRVFKISPPEADRGILELQVRALEHLEASRVAVAASTSAARELRLPRVRKSLEGDSIVEFIDADGHSRVAWLLDFLPGQVYARVRPRTAALRRDLGSFLGRLTRGLDGFQDPRAARSYRWDVAQARWFGEHLGLIEDPIRRAWLETFLERFETEAKNRLAELPHSVIHGDANDHNVLVGPPDLAQPDSRRVVGLIDFGDLLETATVCEVAVAAAYAIFDTADPVRAMADVVSGFHAERPLSETEIEVVFPLVAARLCVSVVTSAERRPQNDAYLSISEVGAWRALEALASVPPRWATACLRHACGLEATATSEQVRTFLSSAAGSGVRVLDFEAGTDDVDLGRPSSYVALDLGVGSRMTGADPAELETEALERSITKAMTRDKAKVGVDGYDLARRYNTASFFARPVLAHDSGSISPELTERRTVHLGIDLYAAAGTPVLAALDGVVESIDRSTQDQGWGTLVILRHQVSLEQGPVSGPCFWTLYGHLDPAGSETRGLAAGDEVTAGQCLGRLGKAAVNGGWPPHLHFQVTTDLLDLGAEFPGVCYAADREIWKSLCPDPNLLLKLPEACLPPPDPSPKGLLARRGQLVGQSLSLSYRNPLVMVRGFRQYLYDETGRAYLDIYNNVPHVGHSHPRVVEAIARQAAVLNTNTRYLHPNLIAYADRLTGLMPEPLRVCFLVNSGSEANELALRLARTYTGRRDILVLEAAYHGHTSTLIDISPYKFDGPGGGGKPDWVEVVPVPDEYRGRFRRDDPQAGFKYAQGVGEAAARSSARGAGAAALIAETFPSVGGQIPLPAGFLVEAIRQIRQAGGLFIADEVQVGFGRLGTHFWGFESQLEGTGTTPDIVVLGKPIGNGHPLAAVVTTEEIARAFNNGMEYFATFGGNPVSCAAGMAMLDVLEEEQLQANALRVGERFLSGFRRLAERHALVGDVRGSGLFLGVELVRDRETLEPADREASYIVNELRARGILCGTDGPLHNVLKVRSPMVITEADAEHAVGVLDEILGHDVLQR